MNKGDLVNAVAKAAGLNKTIVGSARPPGAMYLSRSSKAAG